MVYKKKIYSYCKHITINMNIGMPLLKLATLTNKKSESNTIGNLNKKEKTVKSKNWVENIQKE